ncbi:MULTISPECIES: carbohydrate ABC transporter permease [Micromonospora]|uniref:Carbohydrate ABC transporter membrane protein 1, CUT1 family n=1 Tax=Micromonospora yangpuensis TaxID=683228 RepID=A0A1C6TZC4_9ACTN|nr:sugar ABC transporter permease [Micromonospora yangpuensis]GGM21268.1 sugar ABC transporter permease [Micromonospora yangpuensis]SCL47190.1 carbohydrate ABC transporter membrane protein 1, CUT1 family [Micromonospora yangpuensis]
MSPTSTVEPPARLDRPPTPPAGPAAGGTVRRRRLGRIALYLPALVLVALVSVVPIGYALQISLYRTRGLRMVEFVGWDNFATVLGPEGWADIGRTFAYVIVSLLLAVPLGLGLAVLLNKPIRYVRVFRVVILLPWVVSQTVAALLWKWLLNGQYGPLQGLFGGSEPLASPTGSMAALIIVNVWLSYPLATILCLAALQTVPQEQIEASRVDGCTPRQSFFRIVVPTIRSTLLILVIMLTLLYFNMVTLVYTLTGGGPFSGTQVLSLQAFLQSFQFFKIGIGAAYSVVLFVLNIVFGVAYIRVLKGSNDG